MRNEVIDTDLGCFKDDRVAGLDLRNEMSLKSDKITKSSCKDRCNSHDNGKGFKYSGIQLDGVNIQRIIFS